MFRKVSTKQLHVCIIQKIVPRTNIGTPIFKNPKNLHRFNIVAKSDDSEMQEECSFLHKSRFNMDLTLEIKMFTGETGIFKNIMSHILNFENRGTNIQ